ncbi:MAG: hypothetical protein GF331_17785 [Chitinivibrionales bacterium]|nr:hypothetical protein [Chitinivibrionales bacterium]
MTTSSANDNQAGDLHLLWDPAAQPRVGEQSDVCYTPGVPRDIEPYLRFLEDVMPADNTPGPADMPIDEPFELP